jgi:glycosyltransferase involved in cell wall biosynthesis
MYVGNLESYQGIDLLLDAFVEATKQEPALRLVVSGGSDKDIERYRDRVRALGLTGRAHLIGRWPADRLDELLAESDMLIVPRIRGINTAMKVFPFLHSGKAVVVTDLPTHTQILTDRVAALAPAEPIGFARILVGLARDPERRSELGRAGRAFVEAAHTYDSHRARMNQLYDAVASAARNGQRDSSAIPSDRAGPPAGGKRHPRALADGNPRMLSVGSAE